jgi:hypothetical protein
MFPVASKRGRLACLGETRFSGAMPEEDIHSPHDHLVRTVRTVLARKESAIRKSIWRKSAAKSRPA